MMTSKCISCDKEFTTARGRPPKQCPECRLPGSKAKYEALKRRGYCTDCWEWDKCEKRADPQSCLSWRRYSEGVPAARPVRVSRIDEKPKGSTLDPARSPKGAAHPWRMPKKQEDTTRLPVEKPEPKQVKKEETMEASGLMEKRSGGRSLKDSHHKATITLALIECYEKINLQETEFKRLLIEAVEEMAG